MLVNSYYSYSVLSVFAARAGLDDRHIKLIWLPPEASKIAAGYDVWAVYGRSGQATRRSPEEFRRSLAAALGAPLTVNAVGRYIVLWRFKKPPEPIAPAAGFCRLEPRRP